MSTRMQNAHMLVTTNQVKLVPAHMAMLVTTNQAKLVTTHLAKLYSE